MRAPGSLCKGCGCLWYFALRLYGALGDVTGTSIRPQRSVNAVKAQCMHCERSESGMRTPWNHQQKLCRNVIEHHVTTEATPWLLFGCHDRAFARKLLGFSCDLRALLKIKQLRTKAVETWLGVTGV